MTSTLQPPLEVQGVRFHAPGMLRWCVWAPLHKQVELVVWRGGSRSVLPMHRLPGGYFEFEHAVDTQWTEGLRYAYRLPGIDPDLPDPASHWQPEGVHHPSAVFQPENFTWSDAGWPGLRRDRLSLYELHVGTFTPAGTLDAAIERLPELAELGVTAIELMPLAQFPGNRNWGYDGVHLSAVQNTYGGPRALQRFVDAAHGAGLGVVVDAVYNHFGPEGNYLNLFGPYQTDRYHTPWGQAVNYDGADSDPVRRFVIDSACRWVRDFHVDGLRLDAVQTIYDFSPTHILAELAEAVHAEGARCGRSVVVTAETDQNDVRLVRPRDVGGYGLDAVWSDDFHHALHAVLTGERDGYYSDFGDPRQLAKAESKVFVYDGIYSPHRRRRHGTPTGDDPREQFIVCIQNHDQVGNRACGERLGELLDPAAQRLAAALLLTSPCTPLLFMGEEYGERRRFPFFCSFLDAGLVEAVREGRRREFREFAAAAKADLPDPQDPATFESARLAWQWPEGTTAAGLRSLYQTLLRARRSWPPLHDRAHSAARIAPDVPQLLVVERGANPVVEIYANLGGEPIRGCLPPARRLLLSTEEARFGGARIAGDDDFGLRPWELVITGGDDCPPWAS